MKTLETMKNKILDRYYTAPISAPELIDLVIEYLCEIGIESEENVWLTRLAVGKNKSPWQLSETQNEQEIVRQEEIFENWEYIKFTPYLPVAAQLVVKDNEILQLNNKIEELEKERER